MDFTFAITSFITIFVVVGAPESVAIFLTLTKGMEKQKIRHTALKSCVTALAVLSVFTLFGNNILTFFGITVAAFQVAGGIILFFIGFAMIRIIRARVITTPEEEDESEKKEDISIVPMAVPILAGPASITTVMVLSSRMTGWESKVVVLAGSLLTMIIAFLLLTFADSVQRVFGRTGMNILERVMGLILCVMAAQFVIDGVRQALLP
jgi:multiple antibiotic resistance protein